MKKFAQNTPFVTVPKMIALMLMFAVTLGFQTTFGHAATGCPTTAIEPTISQDNVAKMIEEINVRRAESGVPPMKLSQALTDSALYHAIDMQADGYFKPATFDRDTTNGELVKQCGVYARIAQFYGDGTVQSLDHAAEMNASGDFGNDAGAVNTVLDLMVTVNQYFKLTEEIAWEFGMGYAESPVTGFEKWVLTVGRRDTVFPMIINGEQIETDSQDVEIYMYGEWNTFRLQNNNGDWSQWYSFDNTTNTIGWTLDSFGGLQTVAIEVMAADGTTYTTSDSITYDNEIADNAVALGEMVVMCGSQVCPVASVIPTVDVPLSVGLNGMGSEADGNMTITIIVATLFTMVGTSVAQLRKVNTHNQFGNKR